MSVPNYTMRRIEKMVLLMALAAALPMLAGAGPRIVRNEAGAVQLSVGGKPFLMIGGELHNSSSSGIGYFAEALDDTASLGVNTVLAPVSWQQFERTEGKYDFSLTDGMLKELRQRGLKWGIRGTDPCDTV